MDKDIVISAKTVAFLFLAAGLTYLVLQLWNIVVILAVAVLIVVSLEHTIQTLQKIKVFNRPINRTVAVISIYLLLFLFTIIAVTVVLPPVLIQSQKLTASLTSTQLQILGFEVSPTDFLPSPEELASAVTSTAGTLISNLTTVISIFFVSAYMSIEWKTIKAKVGALLPVKYKTEFEETLLDIELEIGHWLRAQITLMVIIGLMSMVALVVLGVDYPFALGLAAGLLEIIPLLGPVIAAVLAGIVALATGGPVFALIVVGVFIVIQQIENNVLVPKIMQKVSGFSPLVVLIIVIAGSQLFGVIGALIAVPASMIAYIALKKYFRFPKRVN